MKYILPFLLCNIIALLIRGIDLAVTIVLCSALCDSLFCHPKYQISVSNQFAYGESVGESRLVYFGMGTRAVKTAK